LPSRGRHDRETRVRWRSAAVPPRLAPPTETASGSCLPRLESGCDRDRGGPWGCWRRRSRLYHTESCDRIANRGAWVERGPTRRRVDARGRGLPERRPCSYLTAYTAVRSRPKTESISNQPINRRAPLPVAATASPACIAPSTIPGPNPVIAVPGPTPIFPFTTVGPMLVIVEPARTAKLPAVPSTTGV